MEQHFVEEPCQEGWHRPVLSLFAKVFTVFSCKLTVPHRAAPCNKKNPAVPYSLSKKQPEKGEKTKKEMSECNYGQTLARPSTLSTTPVM